jgi:hypothetical protein
LEFPYTDGKIYNRFDAGEIMLIDGLPCSNDIEMILQAFIEEKTQWFYVDSELIKKGEKHISKAIKNPIIIYEVIEKKDENGNPIETSYHEYRQYESNEIYEIEPPPNY